MFYTQSLSTCIYMNVCVGVNYWEQSELMIVHWALAMGIYMYMYCVCL